MKNPLHHMSIRNRLFVILALFLLPIGLLAYELNAKIVEAIKFSEQEQRGAQYTKPMLALLMEISDHQMNTQRKLAGVAEGAAAVAGSAANIDKLMEEILGNDKVLGDALATSSAGLKEHGQTDAISAANIAKEWQAIKTSTSYSQEAYETLLSHVVTLAKHVGDTSNLMLDGDLDTYYLMDVSVGVAPSMLQFISGMKNETYAGLHSTGGQLTVAQQAGAAEHAAILKSLYLIRLHDGITTALKEDHNFNGVNPTLQPSLEPKLAAFEASEAKVYAQLEALSKGEHLTGEAFFEVVDAFNDDASAVGEASLEELNKMIQTRIDALQQSRIHQLGVSGAIVAFAFLLFFVVSNSISRPLKGMTETMKTLASGDTSVEVPSTDDSSEIGDIAKSVLVFKENMIQTDQLRAEQETQKLRAEEEKRQSINSMANSFESSVKSVVTEVSASAEQMRGNAERLSVLADETKSTSAIVSSSATEAAQTATQVAAAAEELTAAIGEISAQVQKSSSVANQASHQAESINQSMHMLVEKSNRVGEVIQFITNIASQINLLALNATIESARAGEAGRGFAVVASEVKNLANQTAKATEEIVQQVQSMQEATQGAVHSVSEIINIISEISASTAGVAAAVEEQSAATNEISRNIAHTASGTNEISRSITSVERGAEETGTSSRQVLDSAKMLSGQAATLSSKVDEFLVMVRKS